ncbi:hypothetical protein NLI96_g5118 [Meripilus lineatus]|uniref:Uncharacterized protein n=1 Tax=Meripilus lineatus TaxID=2056292 RepID=A0AAD5YF23_9APHY|nr:hypothetical protein NLI96_g5118 [Physisporinus lineatus]
MVNKAMFSLIRSGSLKVGDLISSVTTPRWSQTITPYAPTPGVPQTRQIVPNELAIAILQAASDIIFQHTTAYDPFALPDRELRHLLQGYQGLLFNCLLTCKNWYNFGVDILYEYPCLVSPGSIESFASTAISCPRLLKPLRNLYVLDEVETFPTFPYVWSELKPSKSRRPRIALRAIFDACQLPSLTINLRNTSLTTYVTADTLEKSLVRQKKLTLLGHTRCDQSQLMASPLAIPVDHMNLPNLTVLCLREVCLGIPNRFPDFTLPALRTLQILRSDAFPQDDIWLVAANMPSLTTLGLFQNHTRFLLDDVGIQQITTLDLVGPQESQLFSSWTGSRKLECPMKHLTLGVFWHQSDYEEVYNWRLPSAIETLTLCIQLGHDHYPHPDPTQMLQNIFTFLKSSKMWSLTKVSVILVPHPSPGAKKGYDSVQFGLENIELLCRSRKVLFEVTERDHHDWVTQKLVDAQ